jgi:hypothetical protein
VLGYRDFILLCKKKLSARFFFASEDEIVPLERPPCFLPEEGNMEVLGVIVCVLLLLYGGIGGIGLVLATVAATIFNSSFELKGIEALTIYLRFWMLVAAFFATAQDTGSVLALCAIGALITINWISGQHHYLWSELGLQWGLMVVCVAVVWVGYACQETKTQKTNS